jgi:hypothetical protein
MTAATKDRYDALIAAGGIPMARWGEPEEIVYDGRRRVVRPCRSLLEGALVAASLME